METSGGHILTSGPASRAADWLPAGRSGRDWLARRGGRARFTVGSTAAWMLLRPVAAPGSLEPERPGGAGRGNRRQPLRRPPRALGQGQPGVAAAARGRGRRTKGHAGPGDAARSAREWGAAATPLSAAPGGEGSAAMPWFPVKKIRKQIKLLLLLVLLTCAAWLTYVHLSLVRQGRALRQRLGYGRGTGGGARPGRGAVRVPSGPGPGPSPCAQVSARARAAGTPGPPFPSRQYRGRGLGSARPGRNAG